MTCDCLPKRALLLILLSLLRWRIYENSVWKASEFVWKVSALKRVCFSDSRQKDSLRKAFSRTRTVILLECHRLGGLKEITRRVFTPVKENNCRRRLPTQNKPRNEFKTPIAPVVLLFCSSSGQFQPSGYTTPCWNSIPSRISSRISFKLNDLTVAF